MGVIILLRPSVGPRWAQDGNVSPRRCRPVPARRCLPVREERCELVHTNLYEWPASEPDRCRGASGRSYGPW